jgi:hypothetical protein
MNALNNDRWTKCLTAINERGHTFGVPPRLTLSDYRNWRGGNKQARPALIGGWQLIEHDEDKFFLFDDSGGLFFITNDWAHGVECADYHFDLLP